MAELTPVERAKSICEAAGDDFREVLETHLLTGFVFSTPEVFAMGKAVRRDERDGSPDAWFAWVCVGELSRIVDFIPYSLPWIGFYRQGRGRRENSWLPMSIFLRRVK